jgi:hypothetical protein
MISNMTDARYYHTASILTNGEVLIAGGLYSSYLRSAELYNPTTRIWRSTIVV